MRSAQEWSPAKQHFNSTSQPRKILTVLIANRGEVALRIQATCKALGLTTVAVYTTEDAGCLFVTRAHKACKLTGSGVSGYMAHDEIIACALNAGADAVHPGYGFLSENASFARKVLAAGLIWIGPSPESIRMMGNKQQARMCAQRLGIPVTPGVTCSIFDHDQAFNSASSLGFPVIIKDPCAGGGKAMRLAKTKEDFTTAWQRVVSEASVLTGSQDLVIEKYIEGGRHIEVQIAGDGVDAIHFFERDCSVQRRNQKIIEVAPATFCHKEWTLKQACPEGRSNGFETLARLAPHHERLRRVQGDNIESHRPELVSGPMPDCLYTAAIALARAVNYDSIGTVEFLVAPDGNFYFLEMNTRLQVEHSVTESITGIDLVALQVHLAHYKKLPISQTDVYCQGYAIECRIYAEDPTQKFMPSTGTIDHLSFPQEPFVRIDHDLKVGSVVSSSFDPMIAKITCWGMDRFQAVQRMLAVLDTTIIGGITTNLTLLKNIIRSQEFMDNALHTQSLNDRYYFERVTKAREVDHQTIVYAALITQLYAAAQKTNGNKKETSPVCHRWKQRQWRQ